MKHVCLLCMQIHPVFYQADRLKVTFTVIAVAVSWGLSLWALEMWLPYCSGPSIVSGFEMKIW